MKEFIATLDPNYKLDKYHIKDNAVSYTHLGRNAAGNVAFSC